MENPTGTYLHLQRLSTEDGPGIRTTIFLKGCSLRCEWCHNPESILREPQIQRIETNCLRCGTCLATCPRECLRSDPDEFVVLDRSCCDACGACVDACPSGAMEKLGKQISATEMLAEILKDRSFFMTSQGGVTLSGGEPALQADFCAALMVRLRAEGIHTALDTCGLVSWRSLEKILPHTNLVLYDLKEIDPDRHLALTGQRNEIILQNLLAVRDFIRSQSPEMRLWVRTPLIPGATATRKNLEGIGKFLIENLGETVERWELCAFNNLCRDKYRRLGLNWVYEQTLLLTQNELDQLISCVQESELMQEKVIATGATRAELTENVAHSYSMRRSDGEYERR
jgi:pyruvate formate lyase activating enzyme